MATQDERIKGVETQIGNVRERLGRIEGHLEAHAQTRSPHPALITLLSILGVAVIGFWAWVGTRVVDHGEKIAQILTILSPEVLKHAALNSDNPRSAKQVEEVVQRSMKQGERIDPKIVSETGLRFVEAANKAPDAWRATGALLDYSSFLNVSRPNPQPITPFQRNVAHFTWFTAEQPWGKTYALGDSTAPNAAEVHPLDKPDENTGLYHRPMFFLITEARLKLDGMFMKNVIIENSQVDYYGGPVDLENVYFVNCKFQVQQQPNGLEFAKGIFEAHPSVNLKTSLVTTPG